MTLLQSQRRPTQSPCTTNCLKAPPFPRTPLQKSFYKMHPFDPHIRLQILPGFSSVPLLPNTAHSYHRFPFSPPELPPQSLLLYPSLRPLCSTCGATQNTTIVASASWEMDKDGLVCASGISYAVWNTPELVKKADSMSQIRFDSEPEE